MLLQHKILCVDDEAANLRLLERLFRDSYEVISAASGQEALDLLQKHDCAVIISDQRMPGLTGLEFLKRAAELRRQTVRIMLTGYTDAGTLVEAVNSGVVYKYITKPWINEDLIATVKRALQHYETMKAQRGLQLQNERLQTRIKRTFDGFLSAIGELYDLKDPFTRPHAERTRDLALSLGVAAELEREDLEKLSVAAYLHEAVLLKLPFDILPKDRPLTAEEFNLIEKNFESGISLIESVPDIAEAASVLRFFFEYFDGSGQPRGFGLNQIPMEARILAIVDSFDRSTSGHRESPALSTDEALKGLIEKSGIQFDPGLVDLFCSVRLNERSAEHEFELVMT